MAQELLDFWKFCKYANTPDTVWMREIYSGMYVAWDWKDRSFRLMPDYKRGFAGICLPFNTMRELLVMVAAMGGDWFEHTN